MVKATRDFCASSTILSISEITELSSSIVPLGVHHFSYTEFIPSSGCYLWLCNNEKFIEKWRWSLSDYFSSNVFLNSVTDLPGIYIWKQLMDYLDAHTFSYDKAVFAYPYGLSYLAHNNDIKKVFHFGGPNADMFNQGLNELIPLLKKYMRFFTLKSQRLMSKAIYYKIPEKDIERNKARYLKQQLISNDLRQEFLVTINDNMLNLEWIKACFKITHREAECVLYLADGQVAKEIAKRLHLSTRTTEKYIQEIRRKTSSRSTVELILKAKRLLNSHDDIVLLPETDGRKR